MRTVIRFFAVCLVTIVAAAPLAARADMWLHAIGSRDLPSVYATGGCRERGVDGMARRSTAVCPGDGNIQIRQRFSNPKSSMCRVRVWETGMFKFTWHTEFTTNENNVCSMRWTGDNTVELQISN